MAKLVAFYSRAGENYFGGNYRKIAVGNTEKAAKMIAEAVDADIFKIEEEKPYSCDYRKCVAEARSDLQNNVRPKLKAFPDSIDKYDKIYLGYPNYCGTMPMAVYTFLEHFNFSGKTIYPFCTHEGSGLSRTEQDIMKAAKGAAVKKGLAIHGSHVDGAKPSIKNWLNSEVK